MAEIDKIHNFAKKWLGEFKNPMVPTKNLFLIILERNVLSLDFKSIVDIFSLKNTEK